MDWASFFNYDFRFLIVILELNSCVPLTVTGIALRRTSELHIVLLY